MNRASRGLELGLTRQLACSTRPQAMLADVGSNRDLPETPIALRRPLRLLRGGP